MVKIMLRWKKHKAKKGPDEFFKPVVSDTSISSTESPVAILPARSTPAAEVEMVLQNIPNTITSSAVSVVSSTDSVCSDSSQSTQPLSRSFDDETSGSNLAKTSQHTLDSRIECALISVAAPSNKRKRPDDCRRVSYSDLSSASGVEMRDREIKKMKASHDLPRGNTSLLAFSDDAAVLNPLHVFCRMQIEVFKATPADMAQPAPGRKNPIKLNQVGLRCIHCKHLPPRDRVKRAVCYPSSVRRVYHSVSDMKFDHFSNCRGMSGELRGKLETLKKQGKRHGAHKQKNAVGSSKSSGTSSSVSTAEYYHDCAVKMGMSDAVGGIFMPNAQVGTSDTSAALSQQSSRPPDVVPIENKVACSNPPPALPTNMLKNDDTASQYPLYLKNLDGSRGPAPAPRRYPLWSVTYSRGKQHVPGVPRPTALPLTTTTTTTARPLQVLLSSELDSQYLNPLHCFVRRNVEVFVATEEDMAAPAPGRKNRVTRGQVGIRCIHCACLPLKNRVKRAVCYPPSIRGIYHSVSNMKFDHFQNCQGLSTEARAEFSNLQAACSRRSGGGGSSKGRSGNGTNGNSTSQYYHDSARRLHLIDTEQGIRFSAPRPPTTIQVPEEVSPLQSAHDGISALMIAATDPHVRRASPENDSRKPLM